MKLIKKGNGMKRFILIAVTAMFATPAMAQSPQIQPVPGTPTVSEYVLKMSPAEVELLGTALGNLPYKDALPLMNKLRAQIVEQQQVVDKKLKDEQTKKVEPSKTK